MTNLKQPLQTMKKKKQPRKRWEKRERTTMTASVWKEKIRKPKWWAHT